MAVITDVQVQAGDEQVVGGFLHVVLVKVLPDAAGIGAGPEGLSPGLLGTGSRGGDLWDRDKLSENSREGKHRGYNAINQLVQIFQPARHQFIGLS